MATSVYTNFIEPLDIQSKLSILDWLERFSTIVLLQPGLIKETDEDTINNFSKNYLIASLGPQSYSLIKASIAPKTMAAATYKELTDCIKDLAPQTSAISETFKLSKIKQEVGEDLTVYMSRIKETAQKCDYGNSFDRIVRDKFICGLRNEKVRATLLNDKEVKSSAQALTKAMEKENSSNAAHDMSAVNSVNWKKGKKSVNPKSSNQSNAQKSKLKCYKCTLFGHKAAECRTECRFCKKKGHVEKNCFAKKRQAQSVHNVEPQQSTAQPQNEKDTPSYEYLHQVNVKSESVISETVEISENDISKSVQVTSLNHHSVNSVDFGYNSITNKPFLRILINGKYLNMELDSGSSISCISKSNFDRLNLTGCILEKCPDKHLVLADGRIVGKSMKRCTVEVRFKGTLNKLCLYVVDGEFQTLLGSDWVHALFGSQWLSRVVDIPRVNFAISQEQRREAFIESLKNREVFKTGIGQVKTFEAKLNLKPEHRPKFCSARKVPYSLKEQVGQTLDEMEKDGRLVKVDSSDYASPIVPIIKKDKSIRICGDYKGTLNPDIDAKVYPLPVVEDCFVEMKGGKMFTRLDIKQAYNHIRLRECDQILTTINTHQGLYKWTVLSYGLSPAGGIFQSAMDELLKGMKGVTCRVDDILIKGDNFDDHVDRVLEVLNRLENEGFRCNWAKSEFCVPRVVYLGYEIDQKGVKACKSKVETLLKATYPEDLQQLKSFLGAVQYYGRFIPNLSTMIEPLNRLRTSGEWKFGPEEKESFDQLKRNLASDRVLTFYDPDKPLRLDCDASPCGIGAVLSHTDAINGDRPVEFISRTLTPAERNYSQIEKEALAIVWSIKRFHKYLFARKFELYVDHKPLEFILNPSKQIPEMGTSRIIRWALTLSHYDYTIKFRPTGKHGNADFCSRFPLPATSEDLQTLDGETESETVTVFATYMDQDKPLLNSSLISKHSAKDPVISKVMYCIKEGWNELTQVPENATVSIQEYFGKRDELSVEQGCLLWGHRVIIPADLRDDVLKMLHSTHTGMGSTKALARNYVWWPKMDKDIEDLVRHCTSCQINQRKPAKSTPHPWKEPSGPWERVHMDYAGPFLNHMYLVVIDSYSKWMEVVRLPVGQTKTSDTIKALRTIFCRWGLCPIIVSDNGPQFISEEMDVFMKKNGITHIPTPPYHPASNGLAENAVGKFKNAMKRMKESNSDTMLNLQNWLMTYHNTPHTTTGVEPSVRMIGRRIRSALSLLHPFTDSRQSSQKTEKEMKKMESDKRLRRFQVGDQILYRDVINKTWKRGTIRTVSDVQYGITAMNGSTCTRHIDHIVSFYPSDVRERPETELELNEPCTASEHVFVENDTQIARPIETSIDSDNRVEPNVTPNVESNVEHDRLAPATPSTQDSTNEQPDNMNAPSCRPVREKKATKRLTYDKLGETSYT